MILSLDELGIVNDTFVFYSTDNGPRESLGNPV
jgi:hypothetical protein